VVLQWLYSGSTTNKRRTINEGITNLSRRKVEAKAEIKRRLLVDFNFAKEGRRKKETAPPPRRGGGGTSLKEKMVKAIGLKNKTYLKIEES